jgi:hypothetical protein
MSGIYDSSRIGVLCSMARFQTASIVCGGLALHATKLPGIDDSALSRYRLEAHFVAGDLRDHERIVCIKAFRRDFTRRNAAFAQLGAVTENEVLNSILWFDALVKVFVAGKYDIDAVFHQQRFKHLAQLETRAVFVSG